MPWWQGTHLTEILSSYQKQPPLDVCLEKRLLIFLTRKEKEEHYCFWCKVWVINLWQYKPTDRRLWAQQQTSGFQVTVDFQLRNYELSRKLLYHDVLFCYSYSFVSMSNHVFHLCLKGKGNVHLSLCLTKHHDIKTYWEWRYSSTHSLVCELYGGEWSASHPGRFIPRERAAGTHWIIGWVGPRAGLVMVSKRKIPRPRRQSNPDRPDRSQ
jgi:hypothetical protein